MKLAVIGKDVSKSDSPAIHHFILNKFHEPCVYERVSIPPEEFSSRVGQLFSDYDGFNVTIPFKGEIIPFLKEIKGDARAFGAVNTVLSADRTGYNTDGYGFLLMLSGEGIAVERKRVLVLGAGGAGRSCIFKLIQSGAQVFVYERSAERLKQVYAEIGGFTPLADIPAERYDVILNCTGIGMHDTEGQTPAVQFCGTRQPVGEELLSLTETAADLIYVPRESEFLRIAATLGKKTVNGAAMLFYQAYMSDCIYLGKAPDSVQAKKFYEEYREERS